MQFTETILALWVRLKKPVESVITLDLGDVDGVEGIGNNTVPSLPAKMKILLILAKNC